MKRNTFDEDAPPLPPHGQVPANLPTLRACNGCNEPTPIATLAQLGARCQDCHAAYCRAPKPQVDCGDKRKGPRDWAYALQRRHKAGARLTNAQVDAYRSALRLHGREGV
jgi:hypothetical protein